VERTKNFVVGGAARKKMCEKEAEKNLRKVVQVPKKGFVEKSNVIFCNPHFFSADSYKEVKNE